MRLKLIVFDFDQTLSKYHVFKTLCGKSRYGFQVRGPFAASEAGQMRKIEELDMSDFAGPGGFAQAAFGGSTRVEEMRGHLTSLRAHGCEMLICTKGLVGTVRKLLLDLQLLDFFCEVYGNIADDYGMLPFDREGKEPECAALLGHQGQARWGSKVNLIERLMKERGLRKSECVLIEDDPNEIDSAEDTCRTLFVQNASGMGAEHWAELQSMLEGKAQQPESVKMTARMRLRKFTTCVLM
eukprot:TRINITY_DN51095_c0_g1_i1.p1 TRINITY_DN51095_c0_g1~~TRINITY_DN51095_c0_g1_i1.p1  ORF type:complete len:240 (-),score=54.98 TRINITY_DN51095_c0_g1_i1:393-1112(-)